MRPIIYGILIKKVSENLKHFETFPNSVESGKVVLIGSAKECKGIVTMQSVEGANAVIANVTSINQRPVTIDKRIRDPTLKKNAKNTDNNSDTFSQSSDSTEVYRKASRYPLFMWDKLYKFRLKMSKTFFSRKA